MKKRTDGLAMLTMLLPMLCVLALVIVLSGCQRTDGFGIRAACSQWDIIYASRADTLDTVDQIYLNNVKREAFCNG